MSAHTWLYNPETDALWQCPEDYAHVARARGWVDSDGPADEYADEVYESTAAEPNDDVQTNFDPSEHKWNEVVEYLNLYRDTAPGEVERVLTLERAGKNRKTVTGD